MYGSIRKGFIGAAVAAQVFSFSAFAAEEAKEVDSKVEASTEQKEVHIPVSVGILPGIGINGFASGNVVNNFSLGLVATHAGRVDGMALSPVVNLVDRGIRGIELSGAGNLAGELTGAQIGGAFNVSRGRTTGAQFAGAANVSGDALTGWQVAGAFNLAAGESAGWQTAGAANIAKDLRGAQISGGANIVDRLQGAQISVINIGGEVEGAQIGVINIARKVTGLQLGVVNVSSEMYGVPVGIVSIARNGQFHVQGWASDIAPTNLTLKYGSQYLYSLVTVGFEAQRNADERRWLTGLGLGGHIPFGSFYVDVDGTAYNSRRYLFGSSEDALLSQLRVLAGYELTPRLSVFAGVTGNVLVDWDGGEWGDVGLGPSYEVGSGDTRVTLWPGLVAGVQL